VVIGELDQRRARLDAGTDLLRGFSAATGLLPEAARSTLAKFGLGADHVNRRPGALSPGERTRAILAALMASGTNCLVFDEPTNHLDLPAIEQLEQALAQFEGTLLVVSHDRWLLETLTVNRTWLVDDGHVVEGSL
jgi:ATPase subunit of ABC transporter with duplicated ATPase domains